MLREVAQFQVEPVLAARAQPVSGVAATRAQVELHRQLQVVLAFVIAQQQIQLAQGLTVLANRQIGSDHVYVWCGMQRVLPQALVIETETAQRFCRQPGVQGAGILVLLRKPVGQLLWLLHPATGLQRMTLARCGVGQQGGREQRPGQIAHRRGTQAQQQIVQRVGSSHHPSIAQ